MTVKQLWVQAQPYNAVDDRMLLAAMLPAKAVAAGGVGPLNSEANCVRSQNDFVATVVDAQHVSVDVGAGYINFARSIYLLTNDALVTLAFGVASPTLGRRDLVIAQVFDAEAGGAAGAAAISVLAGTPASTPVAPVAPAGSIPLWEVYYAANSTTPTLTDRRAFQAGLVTNRTLYKGWVGAPVPSIRVPISPNQPFDSLQLVASVITTPTTDSGWYIRVNDDATASYYTRVIYNTGGGGVPGAVAGFVFPADNAGRGGVSGSTRRTSWLNTFPDVKTPGASITWTIVGGGHESANQQVESGMCMWLGVGPITSLTFMAQSGNNLGAGSYFHLYGVG